MAKSMFGFVASYQRREKEWEALREVWNRLSDRKRAIIMIVAELWDVPDLYAACN